MKELSPAWDPGDFPVKEINPDTDSLSEILGITDKRGKELVLLTLKAIDKHHTIHQAMIDVSEECVHPNELAYTNYVLGAEVTKMKMIGSNHLADRIKEMEKEMRGENTAEESDDELNFPEEEKQEEEPLVFDDEN